MLEFYDFNIGIDLPVHLGNDAIDAQDIRCTVGNNQHIGGRVSREMPLLRHQRAQDRHQLRRVDVLDRQNARDQLIPGVAAGRVNGRRTLLRGSVGNDLDRVFAGHGRKAVHLQNRKEYVIDFVFIQRLRRHHRHPALDARVDDEILAGYLRYAVDHRHQVGVAEIQRNLLGRHLVTAEHQAHEEQKVFYCFH